jgi:hypothetical protein
MIKIVNKYSARLLKIFSLILLIAICYTSCEDSADLHAVPENNQEYTELMKFCNDATVNILESKKSGDWIFSKYRKKAITGLILIYKDSIAFINTEFFPTVETEYQGFEFVDSLGIKFTASQNLENKTVNYKYIFRFNDFLKKWLLEYAEKKEFTSEESVYHFTDCQFTDNLQQNFSMENFSAEKASSILFINGNKGLYSYKYKKRKYLDSIEIQVNNMRLANITTLKKIFTVEHSEEILHDYPISTANVTALNNIAYYLEQMSITMPAIVILETVIANYPKRIVGYLNLGDALTKTNLKVKAEKFYKQYTKLRFKS